MKHVLRCARGMCSRELLLTLNVMIISTFFARKVASGALCCEAVDSHFMQMKYIVSNCCLSQYHQCHHPTLPLPPPPTHKHLSRYSTNYFQSHHQIQSIQSQLPPLPFEEGRGSWRVEGHGLQHADLPQIYIEAARSVLQKMCIHAHQ